MENKWTLFYEYSKDLFNMEVDRFKRLDDKANNQLRFTYILLTIYSALLKILVIDSLYKINNIVFIPVSLSFIFLFLAWLFYFLSLRLTTVPKLPLTSEVFDLFKEEKLITIQFALSQSMKEAVSEYNEIILKKAKNLRYGYNLTIASVALVMITTGYISYNYLTQNKINTKKEFQMSENTSEEQNNSQDNASEQNDNQPNFDVNIPNLQYTTEGYEDDTTKYKDLIIENSETNNTD